MTWLEISELIRNYGLIIGGAAGLGLAWWRGLALSRQSKATAEKCEIASGDSRLACMRGVIYALIDNSWDGRYALPFCAALNRPGDQKTCLMESVEYLKTTFEKSAEEITKDCSLHLGQPALCLELSAR